MSTVMETARAERSLAGLFSDLARQTSDLISHEARLAKTELSEKVSALAANAATLGVAAVLGLAAVLAATAALILGLFEAGLAPWLAAAITAAAMGLVAFLVGRSGLAAIKAQSLAPVETMQSVKETTTWIRNEMR